MAEGDESGDKRPTRELDREQLRKLARETGERDAVTAPAEGSQPPSQDPPLASRTSTLRDPLTMALLAEVTRNSKTLEIDPTPIDIAVDAAIDKAMTNVPRTAAGEHPPEHPHVKRRRS